MTWTLQPVCKHENTVKQGSYHTLASPWREPWIVTAGHASPTDLLPDLLPLFLGVGPMHLLRLLLVLSAQVPPQDVPHGADVEALLEVVEGVLRHVGKAQVGVTIHL